MDGVAYSRSNKPCKVQPIQHIINALSEFSDYVFDGEILYFDSKFREDFQKVISLTSSDERLEGCDNLYYVIFDMIPKELFKSKDVFISFEDEYELINATLKTTDNPINYSVLNTCLPNILVARQDTTKDKLLELCSLHKWEGLMMRNGEACYEYKRTKNLLKLKQMQDTECTLLDMIAGTGRNSDRLGAFVVDYKGYQVKVGSGFSDEQREMYWRDKDKYIGKAVKVQYFGETKNQHNELSLRFPVFLAFRNTETDDEYLYL
jgi:DNA ligase-1